MSLSRLRSFIRRYVDLLLGPQPRHAAPVIAAAQARRSGQVPRVPNVRGCW